MLEIIRQNVVVPLMGRLGTMTATAIAPFVAHADLGQQIGIGVAAVGLVAFDLVVSYLNRRAVANRMFASTVSTILNGDAK